MNKEIIGCVESDRKDLFNQMNIYHSSYMEEDILAFARTVDDKYTE